MSATTVTLLPSFSFSFYVPGGRKSAKKILRAANFGDAVTVAGLHGPDTVRRLRDSGFSHPALFDGTGYAGVELDAERWVDAQRSAGADRMMMPGVFVPWDKEDPRLLGDIVARQAAEAADLDASIFVAADVRWITKRLHDVTDALLEAEVPVALVLGHPADPLASRAAVEGLRPGLRAERWRGLGDRVYRRVPEASSQYGLAGTRGPENPKAQLTSWALL